jgi:hypothetical protein
MVSEQDFKKQFGNIGIDRESVMNANTEKSLHKAPQNYEQPKVKPEEKPSQEEPLDLTLIKRKMDYLQNSIVAKFNEKLEELNKKIDDKVSAKMEYNREITMMKNDIAELKRKLSSVRVVFSGEDVSEEPQASSGSQPASFGSSKPASSPKPAKGDGNPGSVKVEDYFNFSNHKFD